MAVYKASLQVCVSSRWLEETKDVRCPYKTTRWCYLPGHTVTVKEQTVNFVSARRTTATPAQRTTHQRLAQCAISKYRLRSSLLTQAKLEKIITVVNLETFFGLY